MLQYEDFQRALVAEVERQGVGDHIVELQTVEKNNGVQLPAICIRETAEEITPSIYLDYYFHEHQRGVSCRHLARQIWEQYEEARVTSRLPEKFFGSYAEVRENVFCRLVNYEKNRDILFHVPHEIWQDLAITYYYQVDPGILPDATIQIRKEHLSRWGTNEEDLQRDAWRNSLIKRPSSLRPLNSVLRELAAPYDEEPESSLSLLTNDRRCLGAVCICYPGEMERIGHALGQAYYVLPSSIHECLILPDDGSYERGQLERMVREINRTQLAPQDVLSDHVYHCSCSGQVIR